MLVAFDPGGSTGKLSPDIILSLNGSIVPKARPRITRNGSFMPRRYREWKTGAIAELTCQAYELGIDTPLSGVSIAITLNGKHPRRGDLDNISGSILDALVQSHVLKDDSLAHVQSLAIALNWSKNPPRVVIHIY